MLGETLQLRVTRRGDSILLVCSIRLGQMTVECLCSTKFALETFKLGLGHWESLPVVGV